MKFYLAGQKDFGNRGCEALVRSVSSIIRARIPNAEFLVPTFDRARDAKQWPQMAESGCTFIDGPKRSSIIKWWNRICLRIPSIVGLWEPKYSLEKRVRDELEECDAVLMIGGDTISLDYGPGSLFLWSGFMDAAKRAGHPTILFAASVGPFDKSPVIERYMIRHLLGYSAICVRESSSLRYLEQLGLNNVTLVADPAFTLMPESVDSVRPYDNPGEGVLAFNVSPLINTSWLANNPGKSLIDECAAFILRVLSETKLSVALLPHVDPLDGAIENSDSHFMSSLLAAVGNKTNRVSLVPRGLNAAQLKFIVGCSRFLIAARTHATVAGWSQCVPTVSIAYSVKARGLNIDLFGTHDYVLDTPKVSRETLWTSYVMLEEREVELRAQLADKMPVWRENARKSVDVLMGILK